MISVNIKKYLAVLSISTFFFLTITSITATIYYLNFADLYEGGWLHFFGRQLPIWGIWIFLTLLIYRLIEWMDDQHYGFLIIGTIHAVFIFCLLLLVHFGFRVYQVFLNDKPFVWAEIMSEDNRVSILYYIQYTLIYLVVISLVYGWRWHRNLQDTQLEKANLESELHQARWSTLAAQLQPHFLFNALNSIASLVRQKNNQEAVIAIADLAELLRKSLRNKPQQLLPLTKELEFVRTYLKIEQLRFQDKLIVQWSVSPETEYLLVPVFILQPLVENAIKHGISQIQHQGRLFINTQLEEDRLVLQVKDNGPGPEKSGLISSGLGLQHIQNRLFLLFGDQASLQLIAGRNGGAEARISLPVLSPKDNNILS